MMKTLRERYEAAKARAHEIAETAKAENRQLTPGERAEFDQVVAEATDLKPKVDRADADAHALEELEGLARDPGTSPAGGIVADLMAKIRRVGAAVDPSIDGGSTWSAMKIAAIVESEPTKLPRIAHKERPGVAQFASQLFDLRTVDSDSFSFLRQTTRTNNAAPVAVGALKPTSVYATERITAPVTTIAHLSEPIARQWLEDEADLERFLVTEMVYGLQLALDAQLLNGDGVAPNLEGIFNTTGIQVQAFDTDPLTTCRKALTKLQVLAGLDDVDRIAFVIHPSDWEAVEFLAAESTYHPGAPPTDATKRQLWGARVVVSTEVAAGTALVGNPDAAFLAARGPVSVSWTEAVDDDFSRNLVRWRVEGRFGFGVTHPAAFVSVDLFPS